MAQKFYVGVTTRDFSSEVYLFTDFLKALGWLENSLGSDIGEFSLFRASVNKEGWKSIKQYDKFVEKISERDLWYEFERNGCFYEGGSMWKEFVDSCRGKYRDFERPTKRNFFACVTCQIITDRKPKEDCSGDCNHIHFCECKDLTKTFL